MKIRLYKYRVGFFSFKRLWARIRGGTLVWLHYRTGGETILAVAYLDPWQRLRVMDRRRQPFDSRYVTLGPEGHVVGLSDIDKWKYADR